METYNAKLISADFEKSTMEFEIQHEFDVKAGDYVIMQKADYDKLPKTHITDSQHTAKELVDELIKENTKVQNMEKEFNKDLRKGYALAVTYASLILTGK